MIEKLFVHILTYSYLLPLLFLLIYSRKIKLNTLVFILAAYFIVFFLLNLYFDESKKLLTKKGYYFTYTFLEYIVFAYILSHTINNIKINRLIIVGSSLFSAFLVYHYSTVKVGRIDSIPIGVETILVFIYIFIFFYQHFRNTETEHIYNSYGFWLIAGILIYLGSSFFFNILANEMATNQVDQYWYLTYFGDILKNIFSCVAIVLYSKSPLAIKSKNNSLPYLDMI